MDFRLDRETQTAFTGSSRDIFVNYACGHCRVSRKTYATRVRIESVTAARLACRKFGEIPQFGVPLSSRLSRLLADEKELYLKGRQCENQGLGIGAAAYFRRVVENQKGKLLDAIIKVAQVTPNSEEMIRALEAAKRETQFQNAVDRIKAAIPPAILLDGQNPLTLLHRALSSNIHSDSDDTCLQDAHDVHVVMTAFAEQLGHALTQDDALKASVTRLRAKS